MSFDISKQYDRGRESAARLPKPQFTATITVRKKGAVSDAPDWRKQCLLQESKVIENWSSQMN